MKAKDIALLCTAAAGAGAVAGATITTAGKNTPPKKNVKSKSTNSDCGENVGKGTKNSIAEKLALTVQSIHIDAREAPRLVCTDNDCKSAALIFGTGKDCRAYMLTANQTVEGELPESEVSVRELRCPADVTGAEAVKDGIFFITPKGGVMVYIDKSKESVFCGLTDPEYICSAGGKLYVFSDCLLYICGNTGEIQKTVSLGALIDIKSNDICDAESTDGGFSEARVSIKKCLPLGKGSFAAIITRDRRSYLMHCQDGDFYSFEKTYEDIYDVCVFGGFAYYLCGLKDGYGIIKTKITDKKCETMAKYFLCGKENPPVKLYGGIYGICVLYADGTTKFLLPEISSERKRESCRKKLGALGNTLENVRVQDIFTLGDNTAYIKDGEMFEIKA